MKLVGNSKAIRSPEFHKRKQREHVLRISLVLILAVLIFITPFFVMRYERLQVSAIKVVGNEVTSQEEVVDLAQAELSGNYLWFIPKRNALLISKSKIEEKLLGSIPRLSGVSVELEGVNTLLISVSERKPFALYCEEVGDPKNPSKCFFLDETGNIFSKAPDFSGEVYMLYSSDPILAEPMRTQLIESDKFSQLNLFIENLVRLGFDPNVLIKRGNEYSLVIEGGAQMKWREEQNLDALFRDLESFMRDPKTKKIAFGNLLYIDLRFDNKIYWLPK